MNSPLRETPLHSRHVALGAKTADFGGWDMPIEYAGVLVEHEAVRTAAGVFDVSHMGQAYLAADDGRHETVARALEGLVAADVVGLSVTYA